MFLMRTVNAKPWYNQIVKAETVQATALVAYVLPELVEQLYPLLLIFPSVDLTMLREGNGLVLSGFSYIT